MTELYKIDIAGRFSDRNKNPRIFESSPSKFEAVKPKLLEFLHAFRERNELTENAEKKIASLEETIASITPDRLKEALYDEIIRPLSRMIFFDWNLDSDIMANQDQDVAEFSNLNALVLDSATENGQYVVSVRFTGTVSEDLNSQPVPFSEVWHFVKPAGSTQDWLVAGIQQER